MTTETTELELEELAIVNDGYQYHVLRPRPAEGDEGDFETLKTCVSLYEAVGFAQGYEAARKETA